MLHSLDWCWIPDEGSALDTHVFIKSVERVSHYVQFMSELLDYVVNAGHVPQHTHALCVRVVAHCERAPDGLSEFPVEEKINYKREINKTSYYIDPCCLR